MPTVFITNYTNLEHNITLNLLSEFLPHQPPPNSTLHSLNCIYLPPSTPSTPPSFPMSMPSVYIINYTNLEQGITLKRLSSVPHPSPASAKAAASFRAFLLSHHPPLYTTLISYPCAHSVYNKLYKPRAEYNIESAPQPAKPDHSSPSFYLSSTLHPLYTTLISYSCAHSVSFLPHHPPPTPPSHSLHSIHIIHIVGQENL